MGWTVHGCGIRIVPARGFVRWRKGLFSPADFDGLSCFCLFYLPLVPYGAVHAYDWYISSKQFDMRRGEWDKTDYCNVLPIRWDLELTLRAYLRPWLIALFYLSAMFSFGL